MTELMTGSGDGGGGGCDDGSLGTASAKASIRDELRWHEASWPQPSSSCYRRVVDRRSIVS